VVPIRIHCCAGIDAGLGDAFSGGARCDHVKRDVHHDVAHAARELSLRLILQEDDLEVFVVNHASHVGVLAVSAPAQIHDTENVLAARARQRTSRGP